MIANLLNSDMDEFHKQMEKDHKSLAFEMKHSHQWWYKLWVKYNPRLYLMILICKLIDHKWVDDSYGNPDSGCMAAHCERCGWGFHHQLY